MRITRSIFLVLILVVSSVYASDINSKIIGLSKTLSKNFRETTTLDFKQNLAILEFENISPVAAEKLIGESVSELLQDSFTQSLIFNVIERKRLDQVIEEQKLQLSGLTSDAGAVSLGEILNADVLLVGSVTELGDVFNIVARLVSVESGQVLTSESLTVPKEDMIETAQVLQMQYVEKMGIGLGINIMGHSVIGSNPTWGPIPETSVGNTWQTWPAGFEVRYRFNRNIMASLGLSWVLGEIWWTEATGTSLGWFGNPGYDFTANITADASGFSFPITGYYVHSLTKKLNLFATAGMILSQLRMTYNFDLTEPSTQPVGFQITEMPQDDRITTFQVGLGVGAEYFVTPRLALQTRMQFLAGTSEITAFEDHQGMTWLDDFEDTDVNLTGPQYQFGLSFYF